MQDSMCNCIEAVIIGKGGIIEQDYDALVEDINYTDCVWCLSKFDTSLFIWLCVYTLSSCVNVYLMTYMATLIT